MLLNPFEEQLDLPSLLVDVGDGGRGYMKVVRKEDEPFVDIRSVKADSSKRRREFIERVLSIQNDGLIGSNAGRAIDRVGTSTTKPEILFRADDEVGHGLMKAKQPGEIDIPAIHHNETAGFSNDAV